MNSIYFHKEQRKLLHQFLDMLFEYNMSIPNCDSGNKFFDIHIYNEDDGTIVEFEQKGDARGFQGVEADEYIVKEGGQDEKE